MDDSPNTATSTATVRQMAKSRYSLMTPRFWHGMTLPVWLRLLSQNGFTVSPTRIPAAAAITAASCANSVFSGLETLVYGRRVRETTIDQSPLFIIGHWRSGTTYMHELLVRDPHHAFPNTCQCFAPSHFLLTEWLITRCLGFVMPKRRPMDDMDTGWRRPQEDEFAICNLGIPSPYLFLAYPYHGAVNNAYLTLDSLTDSEKEQWQQGLKYFLQKLMSRENRRIVLKSPTHTGRIQTLLELFPDAKFIHLVRDPFDLFPSTIRLWESLTYLQAVRLAKDDGWLEEYVLDCLVQMYTGFESGQESLSPNQLITVRYEDLTQDPMVQLRKVYDQLELGTFDDASSGALEYVQAQKSYQANRHDLSEGLREKICSRWQTYFDAFGYDG